MSELTRDNMEKIWNDELNKFSSQKNMEMSDADMAGAKGGVGNPGEATCWKCGSPAEWNGSVWLCKKCHQGVSLDDAETIRFIKKMEVMVGKEYILERDGYPVWWNDVVKD